MQRKYMKLTNNQKIAYYDEGQGKIIFMLHGFPDSADVWRKMIPTFVNKGYRVIAPDMRGFGKSFIPDTKEESSIKYIVNDILSLKKFLEIKEPVDLIAHDWGANIGWTLASFFPKEFTSYTAISVGHPYSYSLNGGFEQKKKGWYTMAFLFEGMAEEMFSQNDWAAFRVFTQNNSELDTHWLPDLSRKNRFTAALNLYRANLEPKTEQETPKIPRTPLNILGIYGSNDLYLSESQMTNSDKYISGKFTYEKIEGGHWLPIEKSEELSEKILKFYTNN